MDANPTVAQLDIEAFLTMSTAVNSSLHLRDICVTACRIACEQLGVSHSAFVLFEPGLAKGEVFAEYPANVQATGMPIPLESISEEQQFIRSRQPLEIPNVERDLGPGVFKDNLLRLGVTSVLIVPVIREDVWLGSFSLDSIGAPHVFSEADKRFCYIFAAQIAVAIHNSRQYRASEQRRQQLEALRNAILAILTELDRESLLQKILEQAVRLLAARSGGIYEFSPPSGTMTIIATHNDLHKGKTLRLGEGIAGRLIQDRLSHMIVNDYEKWDHKAQVYANDNCFEAVVEVLLMRDSNTPLGVLYIEAPRERPFQDADAELLKLFAEPAAIAMINSEILAQRDALAHVDRYRTEMLQKLGDLKYDQERPEEVRFRVEVVQRALTLVGWGAGVMYLYNAKHHELQAVVSLGTQMFRRDLVLAEGQGLVGTVAKERSYRFITTSSHPEEFAAEFGRSLLQVAIALPMSTFQELDSVLLLVHDQKDDLLLGAQKDILLRFSSQVSNALQVRTLMDPSRAELDTRLTHLMGGDVRTEEELETLLCDVLTLVTAYFGLQFNRALLFLLSKDGPSLSGKIATGHVDRTNWEEDCRKDAKEGLFGFEKWREKRKAGFMPDTPLGRWIRGINIPLDANSPDAFFTVFTQQEVVVIPPERAAELPIQLWEQLKPTTDTVLVPLVARGEFIGILAVDNKFTESRITRRDLTSLQIYARVAALAINQYDLVRRTTDTTNKLLETIASLSRPSGRDENPTAVLKIIGRETATAFQASSVIVIANDELARRRQFVFGRVRGTEQFGPAPPLDTNSAKVWSDGNPLLLERALGNDLPQPLSQTSVGSAICLPIAFEGKRLGVIWISYDDPLNFPRLDPTTLLFYAGQAGIAYGNARRLFELENLHQSIHKISDALDIREVEASIVRQVMHIFEADSATLWPYDNKNLVFIADELVTEGLERTPHVPGPGGISERLIEDPFYIAGPALDETGYPDECTKEFLHSNGLKSFQGVAMRAGGETQGVLYVAYCELRDYGDSEKRWLMDFANYAALSLRMARSLAQLRKALDAAEDVSSVIVSGNVASTLQSVARTTREAVRCNMVVLIRYDESSGKVQFPPTVAGDFRFESRIFDLDEADAQVLVSRLIKRDHATIAQAEDEMREFVETRFGREEGVRSVVAIPLRFGGRSVGVLFSSYRTRQSFSPQDIRGIQLFADQAAVAMGQAQRFEALTGLSKDLLTVTKEEAMDLAIGVALDQLRVDFCVIVLHVDGEYRVLASQGWSAGLLRADVEHGCDSHAGYTVLRRRPIIVPDFSKTEEHDELKELNVPKRIFDAGIVSGMSVPVIQDGVVVCVMLVHTKELRQFTQQDVDFLSLVANQVVIAQRSAQRYEGIARQSLSLEAFHEAAKVIIERPDFEPSEVLSEILRQSIKHMVADRGGPKASLGTIQVYDENDDSLEFESVEPREQYPDLSSRIGDRRPAGITEPVIGRIGITGLSLRDRKTIRVQDINQASQEQLDQYLVFSPDTKSELAVPLLDGMHRMGVINLESNTLNAFDEHDESTVEILAELAVIAIKQGRIRKATEDALASLGQTVHETRGGQTPLRNETYSLLKGYYGALSQDQRLAILRIQNAVEEQIRRAENIEYVVRAHQGTIEPKFQQEDLQAILGEAVKVFRFQADNDNIGLHLKETPRPLKMRLDKLLIECVFRNLIENALRFCRRGDSVTITPETRYPGVQIEVRDTGIGIPAEKLNKVFGLFYQVPEHKTHTVRGTGIGLNLSKKFIELHGGWIDVESQEGKGSIFRVNLPINPAEQKES
jgi:GAF domain-containing protein